MALIRTRQERLQEEAEHKGKDHYKIFYNDGNGKKIQVSDFWAVNKEEAFDILEIFRKKQALVNPNDTKEYFYGRKGGFITDMGNGLEAEYDDFGEGWLKDKKENLLEKIGFWFKCRWWKLRDLWYMLEDFWFFFKHYDRISNGSHNRNESWSLDSHILEDIEFNVPLIKKYKGGVPTEFCIRARTEIHKDEKDFNAEESYRKNPNSSEAELELGDKLWNEELDRLLLHVRLYRYYSDHGIIDKRDQNYIDIEKQYKNTLPYLPGTYSDFDYEKLSKLTENEWNAIWDWFKEYGQSCWT